MGVNFQPGDCARGGGTALVITGAVDDNQDGVPDLDSNGVLKGKVLLTWHFGAGECWSGWQNVEIQFGVHPDVYWYSDTGQVTRLSVNNNWVSIMSPNMLEIDWP